MWDTICVVGEERDTKRLLSCVNLATVEHGEVEGRRAKIMAVSQQEIIRVPWEQYPGQICVWLTMVVLVDVLSPAMRNSNSVSSAKAT